MTEPESDSEAAVRPAYSSTVMLYLNTLRHLQPSQVAYLATKGIRRRLAFARRMVGRLAVDRLNALEPAMCRSSVPALHVTMASAEAVLAGEFRFIGEARQLSRVRWGRRYGSPLWSFHLQYCNYVEDLARAFQATGDERYLHRLCNLVTSWITAPKPIDSDAWSPYVVARRLVHWTRALLICRESVTPAFMSLWVRAISEQTSYLARNVEWHLLGNHVQKNLHAIFCASALFDDARFDALRSHAAGLLWQQLRLQVLGDGMHIERSPMYHADMLSDYREAAAVTSALMHERTSDPRARAPTDLPERLEAMTAALGRFVRSDGSLHLFNDAANTSACVPGASYRGGSAVADPSVWSLPDAGYYGFCDGRLRLIIDCGDLGPSYQPAHGHCDLLSFELDIDGLPFIVDSGTSGYDGDPLREYMRSTRAHNTVEIAGREQHELWGTFRVARRARVRDAGIDGNSFTGSYSPFYSDGVVHTRTVSWNRHEVDVRDQVLGAGSAAVQSYLHLHPSFSVRVDGERVTAVSGPRSACIEMSNVSAVRVIAGRTEPPQGWYAPEFGRRLQAPVLQMTAGDRGLSFGYHIRVAS